MNFIDFIDWIEEKDPELKKMVLYKSLESLSEQNNELETKKRKKTSELEKIARRMWQSTLEILYNNVEKSIPKEKLKKGYTGWIDYLEEKEIAASFREGVESL
ncbi:hypothetical protein [Enterococcus faecium]|uniref:hypothetical protein n=1 Tax=Enterococcus faecium TaxID=1352 RepID=UPI000BF18D5A|nr:hypothetical protein [Enterococcus faecium]PEH49595.1 hypothetical protein CRM75_01410 [Enterococcus faecium]